jgi:hypothetical protein
MTNRVHFSNDTQHTRNDTVVAYNKFKNDWETTKSTAQLKRDAVAIKDTLENNKELAPKARAMKEDLNTIIETAGVKGKTPELQKAVNEFAQALFSDRPSKTDFGPKAKPMSKEELKAAPEAIRKAHDKGYEMYKRGDEYVGIAQPAGGDNACMFQYDKNGDWKSSTQMQPNRCILFDQGTFRTDAKGRVSAYGPPEASERSRAAYVKDLHTVPESVREAAGKDGKVVACPTGAYLVLKGDQVNAFDKGGLPEVQSEGKIKKGEYKYVSGTGGSAEDNVIIENKNGTLDIMPPMGLKMRQMIGH